jgi:peptidyl-prolyl cis-trans isomerase SurA
MIKFLRIITIIFLLILNGHSALAIENKILLKVDNKLITSIDILDEINYLKSINQNINKLENNKIFEIARNSLIKDKIKEIAIGQIVNKIEINDKDFTRILISNYSKAGYTEIEKINEHIAKFNINKEMLRKKMTINAIWNQFIYDKYSSNIKIDTEKLKQDILKDQIEYLLSEITFDLQNNQTLDEKFDIIKKGIKEKGFENSALIYSTSETSTSGGKIGWISENSLSPKILKKISEIKINEYTNPITIPGGFLIIKLNEKRTTKRKIEFEEELNKIIKIKTNEQLNQFSNIFLNKIKKDVIINEL